MRFPGTSLAPTPVARPPDATVSGLRDLITKHVYYFAKLQPQSESARSLTIGRDPTCDIVLADTCISAVHGIVHRLQGGTYELRDNGSRNGTFLLNAGIRQRVGRARLTMGSRIILGGTTLATVNQYGKTLLSATTETEFRRQAYRIYGTLSAAGNAIGKSPETIRRALQKAQAKRSASLSTETDARRRTPP